MMRTAVLATAILAATAGLTACSEEQAYCVDLAGYAASSVNVDPQNPADYTKILEDAKKLADSAPAEVKDDWQQIVTFAQQAQKAGSDQVELARLSRATGKVTAAYKEIAAHAKESCKVDVPEL
jgi:hypothetical protein